MRKHLSAAPHQDVEIEHAACPASACATSELSLDGLYCSEHRVRPERAFDKRHRIGKVAARGALRWIDENRRGVKQDEVLIELGNGSANDAGGSAVRAV